MRCRPINLNEVVGGQVYIRVSVALSGRMGISYPVFCGQPRWKCAVDLFIRTQEGAQKEQENSTSDMGLNPERRYNYHRVFRYNLKNREILADLVRQQDLRGYLSHIGVDPEGAVRQLRRKYEEWKTFSSYDDRDPYDDLLLLIDRRNSRRRIFT